MLLLIKESDVTGDGGVQVKTTGDNSPIVGGDYVARDKIVNEGPSLEDIKTAWREVEQEKAEYLNTTYGSNYAVGAITPVNFVGLKGEVPPGIEIKWETGRVIDTASKYIEVKMPQIEWGGLHIEGNTTVLPKEVGATGRMLALGDSVLVFEVIGINKDIVTVCLAIVPK